MSDTAAILTGEGATRAADEALCIVIGRDLTETFPGYFWNVGVNHESGVIAISLAMPGEAGNTTKGFLMYISTAVGPGGQKKTRQAGGELLERWGLPRGRAPEDVIERALEHGLDRGGEILKSRH
jgi:hypothetical protein